MDADEYLYFIDRAFDGMLCALRELGDDRANQTPPTAGANSPWAIAYHCTEVADYWIGHLIAGRLSRRNRAAEFFAHGTVGELADRIDRLRRKLRTDLSNFSPSAPLVNTPPPDYEGPSRELTAAGVLLHVLEELAQHHGQVQMSRDILNQTAQARS
jgi:uncharacterized damage-inducible protein DinB